MLPVFGYNRALQGGHHGCVEYQNNPIITVIEHGAGRTMAYAIAAALAPKGVRRKRYV